MGTRARTDPAFPNITLATASPAALRQETIMSSTKRVVTILVGLSAAIWVAACCCKNCPPPDTSGSSGGAPSNSTSLTSNRYCDATHPCGGTSSGVPFDCTAWDQCLVTGGTGAGRCKLKLVSGAKCVAGARLQCTTASNAEGVWVCNSSAVAPACDWPSNSCLKCGGTVGAPAGAPPEPCCVTGCAAGFRCGAGAVCVPS
jgi:hypothetical protein